jgi:phage regulator Rha-like protein
MVSEEKSENIFELDKYYKINYTGSDGFNLIYNCQVIEEKANFIKIRDKMKEIIILNKNNISKAIMVSEDGEYTRNL